VNLVAHRVSTRPETVGHGLVHDYNPGSVGAILLGKISPIHERDLQGLEIIGTDHVAIDTHVFVGRGCIAPNLDTGIAAPSKPERDIAFQANGLYPRVRANSFD
jgi:hypothetical protein